MAKVTIDIKDLIKEQIGFVREDTQEIKEHLKNLNGQVAKNTEFRNFMKGLGKATIIITSISTILGIVVYLM